MWAIIKKEFKQYFLSPIGYIFIGVFIFVYGNVFYNYVFLQQSTTLPYLFSYWIVLVPTIIMAALLTMRTFAEERKNGTEQLLLTSPRSVTSIVLGKFIAATCVVVVTNLLFFMYYIILSCFGNPDFVTTLLAVVGFVLLLMTYVAFGMFASSLVENQIIAVVISIAYFIATLSLPNAIPALNSFSPLDAYFNSFASGTLSIQNLVFLLSLTVMFLIFTIMVIQRRKNVK